MDKVLEKNLRIEFNIPQPFKYLKSKPDLKITQYSLFQILQ